MKDLEIILENKTGALALLGEIQGSHAISLQGGGVFTIGDRAVAHFLVEEADKPGKYCWKRVLKFQK